MSQGLDRTSSKVAQDPARRTYPIAAVEQSVEACFARLGLPAQHARTMTRVLVDNELRGYDSHGVFTLSRYAQWYQAGALKPDPEIRTVRERACALVLDGGGGAGVVPGVQAMQWCIGAAKERGGIASAVVRNAGYAVVGSTYVAQAAEAGLIGFACTNSNAMVAPPGGKSRVVSTNPLAWGVPAGRHPPVIFDMASTAVAMGTVVVASQQARQLPDGLIADAQGNPTSDPTMALKGGTLLPLGYPHAPHKGFGLALVADLLAGVLSGAPFGRDVDFNQSKVGQFFWAIDVEAFMDRDEFLARVDAEIDQVKSSERLEGVEEIFVPGERGLRRRERLLAAGTLTLSEQTWRSLERTSESLGVPPPTPHSEGAP